MKSPRTPLPVLSSGPSGPPHAPCAPQQTDLAFNTKFEVLLRTADGAESAVQKSMQDYISLFISSGASGFAARPHLRS